MYNNVTMMGRITKDPELKVTPNGTSVCSFSIAVERQYQTKGEERKSDFFNVIAWRTTAEFICKWFSKGNMILVTGEMQTRPYTNKYGCSTIWYEIVANRVCFTGEKKQQAPLPPELPNCDTSPDDVAPIPEAPDIYPF
ncbi:MAG: single-stranded DNA-binding protein [Oscillospiraceae bacterium]